MRTGVSAVVADFIGGPASGKSVSWGDDKPVIWLPVYREAGIADYWLDDAQATAEPAYRLAVYRRTGVRDDGRRVYAYDAMASTA